MPADWMSPKPYSLIAVASVPPPTTGQSLAFAVLERQLQRARLERRVIDLSRPFYAGSPFVAAIRRAMQTAQFPVRAELARRQLHGPMLYLQLGQSTQAMLRDAPLLLWARSVQLRTIVHVHGAGFRRALEAAPAPLHLLMRALLADVAAAIVLSPCLAPMFEGLLPRNRVQAVANAPEEALSAAALECTKPRRSSRGLTCLYLSNLMDRKGYGTLLEVARLSSQAGLHHRFVFAGSKTQMGSLDVDDYIREHRLENARYVGPVEGEGKLDLLRSADVFALPTFHPDEGQPISILEAMQFGLPIISTRQGAIPDLIDDETQGLLVPPRDAKAILGALERLADGPTYERISAAAKVKGHSYSAARHGREMISVFDLAFTTRDAN